MRSLHEYLLPFEDLDAPQFESFVLETLGAGISLDVLEEVGSSVSVKSEELRAVKHRLIRVAKYGAAGRGGQRGIDLQAVTESGQKWGFQCKHYTSPFTPSLAKKAIEKASREYSQADRYFLVLSGEPPPKVHDLVESYPDWELWGGSQLSSLFYNAVPREKQIEIIKRYFPADQAGIIGKLYPLHEDLLVDKDVFFERWKDSNRYFHHNTQFVGREDFLRNLHHFVEGTDKQVLILPAPGGRGKTRLLREFGETFAGHHSQRKLWFVDPYAPKNSGSDRLRAALPDTLVVVQDDAHRMEGLRQDIVEVVLRKGGKLIFATRPHGEDALRSWLAGIGADYDRIQVMETLPPLSYEESKQLACSLLPESRQQEVDTLVRLAGTSTLMIVAGARLLAQANVRGEDFVGSQAFQMEVFHRLEKDVYGEGITAEREEALRRTLEVLAILAPWNQREPGWHVVELLSGLNSRDFLANMELLHVAGLMVGTREGWRVIPDLLADYLVYRACYDQRGALTLFGHQLHTELSLEQISTVVLRNLAEAEWQAQLNGQNTESLLKPIWQKIRKEFPSKTFWERAQLVNQWKRIAVFQPECSLELARLAIDLTEAPPAPDDGFGYPALYKHERVLEELPELLKPIAVYHGEYRTEALEFLWELYLKNIRKSGEEKDGSLIVIGQVARFAWNHPADAPLAVVRWLADKLRQGQGQELYDQPSVALSVMLKPLFERVVERSFVTGKQFLFQTHPLSASKTREVREEVLNLLRDLVHPHGEIAILNSLPVLQAAMDTVRVRWGIKVTEEMQSAWLPDRLMALKIVENLVISTPSPRVRFRIMQVLRALVHRGSYEPFRVECKRVLELIPDTEDLRMARVLLSYYGEEFREVFQGEDLFTKSKRSESERLWEQLADQVAVQMMRDHPSPPVLLKAMEQVAKEYQQVGFSPRFSDLLMAIARQNGDFAADCVDCLLMRKESEMDPWWTSWFVGRIRLPDIRLKGWIIQVLKGQNVQRWHTLLAALSWQGIGTIDQELSEEIERWAAALDDKTLPQIVRSLCEFGVLREELHQKVFCRLNLEKLSVQTLELLANHLGVQREVEYPVDFIRRFIAQLHRLDTLNWEHDTGKEFLGKIAEREPVRFYEMLVRRIELAIEYSKDGIKKDYTPLPFRDERILFSLLPKEEGYAKIVEELFQRWRFASGDAQFWWRHLFQDAVLAVSSLGMDYLRDWLSEATRKEELEEMIEGLRFEGSMFIFEEPALVRLILRKVRDVAPLDYEEFSAALRRSAAPHMRGYVAHELEPEYRYYREAAARAVEIHARDSDLAPFYREIVREEDADREHHRQWAVMEDGYWN